MEDLSSEIIKKYCKDITIKRYGTNIRIEKYICVLEKPGQKYIQVNLFMEFQCGRKIMVCVRNRDSITRTQLDQDHSLYKHRSGRAWIKLILTIKALEK